ncbi:MAG: alkaline phosphatase family protein, partial [Myxococcales bacterium]|nr:alkaline phosphatase family protein [Myxococcales bacterium]
MPCAGCCAPRCCSRKSALRCICPASCGRSPTPGRRSARSMPPPGIARGPPNSMRAGVPMYDCAARRAWVTLVAWCLAGSGGAVQAAPARTHVLVVSLDGLGWTGFQELRASMPTLTSLAKRGGHGPLTPVFPTMTWPAHVTLVTGATPAQHGVVGNRWWDRATRKGVETWQLQGRDAVRLPTVMDRAHAAGIEVGALLWPATSNAPSIRWNLPEVYGQDEFEAAAAPELREELRQAGLPMDEWRRVGADELFLLDSFVRDAAVHLIEKRAPRLLLVHLVSHDTAQHQFGPNSRPALWTARLVDQVLADLLAAYTRKGLLDQTDVLVVSDHGFVATNRYAAPAAALRACGLSLATTGVAINGHGLFLYLPTALARDPSAVAAACAKHPEVARALPAADSQLFGPAPSGGANARVPDIVLVAKPEFVWSASRVRKGPPLTR